MKTRIITRYLAKEGYNEINDREVDMDEYKEVEVKSVEEGRSIIAEKDLHGNGIGTIHEEMQREEGDTWEELRVHHVSEGVIYDSELL